MTFAWKNLPVFVVWLTAASMLDTSLHQFTPPLIRVAWLSAIPLAVSFALLALAFARHHEPFPPRRFFRYAGFLMGITMLTLLPRPVHPLARDTHRLIYETSAIAEFIILAVHGRTWLKGWDWAWIFGVTLVFGMILENGGIFMGFFREEGYLLYLHGLPAPLATMLGWVNVLYCGFFTAEKILPGMRPVFRGLVCAGIALSMDIPFDPVATRLSWWVWDDSLGLGVWGVPAVNYVAWFWALFPYAWCYYAVRGRSGTAEGKKFELFLALVPLILVVELAGLTVSLMLIRDERALEIVFHFFRSFMM